VRITVVPTAAFRTFVRETIRCRAARTPVDIRRSVGEDGGLRELDDVLKILPGLPREEAERIGRCLSRLTSGGPTSGDDGPTGDVIGPLSKPVVLGPEVDPGIQQQFRLGLVEHLLAGAIVHLTEARVVGVDGGTDLVLGGADHLGGYLERDPAGAEEGEPGEQGVGRRRRVAGGGCSHGDTWGGRAHAQPGPRRVN
jgi:hypothetical protein